MNARSSLILISMLISGALLAGIFSLPKQSSSSLGNPFTSWASKSGNALPMVVVTNFPAEKSPFRWNQVANNDLNIYRDNLLAIGCPEITTREIIRAVINENFASRRREIIDAFEPHFWELVLHAQLDARQLLEQTQWGTNLATLAAERQQKIGEVLGCEFLDTEIAERKRREELQQQRSWLSPEKRARLSVLEEKHQQRLARWSALINSQVPSEEQQEELQKLENDFAEAKSNLLSANELKELQLRECDAAAWVSSLPGFTPTQDEWFSLVAARLDLEKSQQDLDNSSLTGDELQTRQKELQSQFDAAAKAVLGDDQFAKLQLAGNGDYQSIHDVTERYGLSDTVASESFQVQQSAQQLAAQVRADPNLSAEALQSALNVLQQQTQNTLSQILGPHAFSTYQEYGGDWLEALNQPTK